MMNTKREIKEVVINGGGARGAGMPGVYRALKDTGIWDGVESIAGTSVGSVMAALWSVSPDFDELDDDFFNKNTFELLGMKRVLLPYNISLDKMEKFINQYLTKHIKNYLENAKLAEELLKLRVLESTTENIQKIKQCRALLLLLDFLTAKEPYSVTFNDFKLLNDRDPKKFKTIFTTSVSVEKGKEVFHLYDYKRTPDVSIALACTASSALPIVFTPVQSEDASHIDGGCIDPLPSEYFEDNTQQRQSKRLLLAFSPGPDYETNYWHNAMHGRPNPEFIFLQLKPGKARTGVHYVWVDNKTKLVHYNVPSKDKQASNRQAGSISFVDLGIAKDQQILNAEDLRPYSAKLHTHLAVLGHIPSLLGSYSMYWLLNYFVRIVKMIVAFPMYASTIIEEGCQRVKIQYPFNTVLLRTTISSISFDKAEKIKRTVAATYYLDTMNHLTLYNFADDNDLEFYKDIVQDYMIIYKTLLLASGLKDVQQDPFIQKYTTSNNNERWLYEMIKEDVDNDPDSLRAAALTRAVELSLGKIDRKTLLKEINQESKKSISRFQQAFYGKRHQPQAQFRGNFSREEVVEPADEALPNGPAPVTSVNKIERLVFSGGGARGVVYPGAYAAMVETGVFNDVEEIAGSSVGALTAAFLAVGMPPSEYQTLLRETNFSDLLGNKSKNSLTIRDAAPLYKFTRDNIKKSVVSFLEVHDLTDKSACSDILHKLQHDQDYKFTFADLDQLKQAFPKRFKHLTVTAVKENGGHLKLFNHLDTPGLEIALGVKASAALPLVLEPVEIDGVTYIDGGVADNLPTEVFDRDGKNLKQENTLVFSFVEGEKNEKKTIINRIVTFFFGASSGFEALYGTRANEKKNRELFDQLFKEVIDHLPTKDLSEDKIKAAVAMVSKYNSKIPDFFDVMHNVLQQTFNEMNDPKTKKKLLARLYPEQLDRVGLIVDRLAPKLFAHGLNKPPTLFNPCLFEKFVRNDVIKFFSAFKSSYNQTDKKNQGFENVYKNYSMRTVGLGIGALSAFQFDKANKLTRFISARGYLDTMNTITNLDLHHPSSKVCLMSGEPSVDALQKQAISFPEIPILIKEDDQYFIYGGFSGKRRVKTPLDAAFVDPYLRLNKINFLDGSGAVIKEHVDNIDLYPNQLYSEIVMNFLPIYKATLLGTGVNPAHDALYKALTGGTQSTLSLYYLIKEKSESAVNSHQAFALTRAVELRKGELTHKELANEITLRCHLGWASWCNLFSMRGKSATVRDQNIDDCLRALPGFGAE